MYQEGLLIIGLAAIFMALSIGVLVAATAQQHKRIQRTLAVIGSYHASNIVQPETMTGPQAGPALDRVVRPWVGAATRFARRFSPKGTADRIGRRLDYAGNPSGWTVERIFAWKSIAAFVGGGAALVFGHGQLAVIVIIVLIGFSVGFFLPDVLLYNAGLKRQQKLQRELPDALDLLVISVEAGLGFDAALLNAAQKMQTTALAGEFIRVLQEMQIGRTRMDAFRSMGDRTTVPELRSFAQSLVQADKLGIPIANVLREQSDEMRVKRHQRAEEIAQKVAVKILFPLIFCIMPSLFIVILGPAFLQIYHTIIHP